MPAALFPCHRVCFASVQGPSLRAVGILNGPAAAKAGIEIVPEADFSLAIAPTQEDVSVLPAIEEVDEPLVDVLDEGAELLDLAELIEQRLVKSAEERPQPHHLGRPRLIEVFGRGGRAQSIEIFMDGAKLGAELPHDPED